MERRPLLRATATAAGPGRLPRHGWELGLMGRSEFAAAGPVNGGRQLGWLVAGGGRVHGPTPAPWTHTSTCPATGTGSKPLTTKRSSFCMAEYWTWNKPTRTHIRPDLCGHGHRANDGTGS